MTDAHRAGNGDLLEPSDTFLHRHIGPQEDDVASMLERIGCASLDALIDETVPEAIRLPGPLRLGGLGDRPLGEREVLDRLRALAQQNVVARSCIGMGRAYRPRL